jgi:acetyltransferase-like isoleucine patch superfamily enzyme
MSSIDETSVPPVSNGPGNAMHLGERFYELYGRFKARLFTLFLRRQFSSCGTGVVVVPPFRFANLQHIALEDHVIINQDCWIHAIGAKEETSTPKIVIKAHTHIGMGATISAIQRIVLEKHVLLARNVYISDHGHAYEDVNTPIMFQGIRDIRPVSIGEHTWIGQNVCVMPGVQIGKHCVVGGNSVVTRDLPDFCVAVGSPARVVRQYDKKTQRWEKVSRSSESAA